jgi:hypothetical protein
MLHVLISVIAHLYNTPLVRCLRADAADAIAILARVCEFRCKIQAIALVPEEKGVLALLL